MALFTTKHLQIHFNRIRHQLKVFSFVDYKSLPKILQEPSHTHFVRLASELKPPSMFIGCVTPYRFCHFGSSFTATMVYSHNVLQPHKFSFTTTRSAVSYRLYTMHCKLVFIARTRTFEINATEWMPLMVYSAIFDKTAMTFLPSCIRCIFPLWPRRNIRRATNKCWNVLSHRNRIGNVFLHGRGSTGVHRISALHQ